MFNDNLEGIVPKNKILFNEKSNEFSIILPIGLDKKVVEEKISQTTSSLTFEEQIDGMWVNSDIKNSDIDSAKMSFGESGKPIVIIKFKQEKVNLFKSFTERNLKKEVKISIKNEEIFSGTVDEIVTNGEINFPKDSISVVRNIVAKINMGNSNALTFVNENNKKILKDT